GKGGGGGGGGGEAGRGGGRPSRGPRSRQRRGPAPERRRAAAVIRDPLRSPPHLSLPPLRGPALNIAHGNPTPSHIENGTKGDNDDDHTQDRKTRRMAEGSPRAAEGGEGTHTPK